LAKGDNEHQYVDINAWMLFVLYCFLTFSALCGPVFVLIVLRVEKVPSAENTLFPCITSSAGFPTTEYFPLYPISNFEVLSIGHYPTSIHVPTNKYCAVKPISNLEILSIEQCRHAKSSMSSTSSIRGPKYLYPKVSIVPPPSQYLVS